VPGMRGSEDQARNRATVGAGRGRGARFLYGQGRFEVRSDVTVPEMGNFRWLTVGPAGQPDIAIVLMAIPGPPVMDGETAEQVRTLMGKGFAGTIFLTTDDVRADFDELKGRGVEFVAEPQEQPYGSASSVRVHSGTPMSVT